VRVGLFSHQTPFSEAMFGRLQHPLHSGVTHVSEAPLV